MKLLDLFCGAGGAAMGYHRAGFEVVGVDIKPQPRYPFEFHQGDALEYPLDGFDVVHASPPCQAHSTLNAVNKNEYPDLISATRDRIACLPYVIENVVGAPLRNPLRLCGTSFGQVIEENTLLGVERYECRRHREFEVSMALPDAPKCQHHHTPLGIYGDLSLSMRLNNAKRRPNGDRKAGIGQARVLLGIDWMTPKELTQAIPPAYTEYIGRQLMDALR